MFPEHKLPAAIGEITVAHDTRATAIRNWKANTDEMLTASVTSTRNLVTKYRVR